MKKLFLISALLLSFNCLAETYTCQEYDPTYPAPFTFTRVELTEELIQFMYQTKEHQELYSIVRETDTHLHLVRDFVDRAYYRIIGKKDQKYSGVYLAHNSTAKPIYGSCYLVKE